MTTEIITPIAKFIAEKILKQPNKVITADESLISSGLIDSFSLMDLALFIEDTFGIRVEDTELNDGFHLSFSRNFFDKPKNMLSGWPWRNLTALQALDAVRRGLQEQ